MLVVGTAVLGLLLSPTLAAARGDAIYSPFPEPDANRRAVDFVAELGVDDPPSPAELRRGVLTGSGRREPRSESGRPPEGSAAFIEGVTGSGGLSLAVVLIGGLGAAIIAFGVVFYRSRV